MWHTYLTIYFCRLGQIVGSRTPSACCPSFCFKRDGKQRCKPMQTYPTGYTESHRMAEKIFREILPRHSMAVREEQIALCHEVLDTLYNKEISLCEAGVGTGKTLAYLVGCILWQMHRPEQMKLPIVFPLPALPCRTQFLRNICQNCLLSCWTRVSSPHPSQPLSARAKSVLSAMPALPKEHRWCIRNERGRKAACALQKIFWTWIISRNSPAMTAAGFVCRSPARAIAFCAWIAATSNICGIP